MVTERPRSSEASNHEPWKVGEDFSSPSLLKGLKQDSLYCHESAGDMWYNFSRCDRMEESQMLLHATSKQLGIPPVPLHLLKKHNCRPSFHLFLHHLLLLTCTTSLSSSHLLLLATQEWRVTMMHRYSRPPSRKIVLTDTPPCRTNQEHASAHPCIHPPFLNIQERLSSNQGVRHLLARCHYERRWRTPELKRKQQSLEILA